MTSPLKRDAYITTAASSVSAVRKLGANMIYTIGLQQPLYSNRQYSERTINPALYPVSEASAFQYHSPLPQALPKV